MSAKHGPRPFVSEGPQKKAILLWANLKLDMLIPHVIQFDTVFKLYYFLFYVFIDFREKVRRETLICCSTNLLFQLSMCSFVDSCMCPDQGSNPQP